MDTATAGVDVSVLASATILPSVSKIFDFEKTEYRADFLHADSLAQTAPLVSPIWKMARNYGPWSEWTSGSDFGSFSVAEKNTSLNLVSVCFPAVDGKLAVPPYLFDIFYRRAVSRAINDNGTAWTSFKKGVRVEL